jgi:hypothetical protein
MILHSARWLFILFLALLAPLSPSADAPAPAPDADGKVVCPQCNGEGTAKCEAKGCVRGKVPCPRTCIKRSATWEKHKDANRPQVELWTKVYCTDHQSYMWFPDTAIGHLVEYKGGTPVDAGVCPDCKGSGVAECPTCHGTGKGDCPLCKGEKKVPEDIAKAWIAKRDEERAGRAIVLNDGTVIYGKVISRMPDKVMIKTDEGKMVDVKPGDIKSEPPPEPKKKPEAKQDDAKK